MLEHWRAETRQVDNALRHSLWRDGAALSFREVFEAWQHDPGFRRFYTALIRDSSFDAVFWETPPVTRSTLDKPYEFALIDAPSLVGIRANSAPFSDYLPEHDGVATFENLGRDALLVAPSASHATDSAHLAGFLRSAPESLIDDFWRAVGSAVMARTKEEPLWLNTSGLGVYWLHVRLDSRPKYYTHAPYRRVG